MILFKSDFYLFREFVHFLYHIFHSGAENVFLPSHLEGIDVLRSLYCQFYRCLPVFMPLLCLLPLTLYVQLMSSFIVVIKVLDSRMYLLSSLYPMLPLQLWPPRVFILKLLSCAQWLQTWTKITKWFETVEQKIGIQVHMKRKCSSEMWLLCISVQVNSVGGCSSSVNVSFLTEVVLALPCCSASFIRLSIKACCPPHASFFSLNVYWQETQRQQKHLLSYTFVFRSRGVRNKRVPRFYLMILCWHLYIVCHHL